LTNSSIKETANTQSTSRSALRTGGRALIPHDATLVISEMARAGGRIDIDCLRRQCEPRLTNSFAISWNYLLDSGLVDSSEKNGADSVATKLHPVVVDKVPPHEETSKKKVCLKSEVSKFNFVEAKLRSFEATKLRSYEAADPNLVLRFLASATESKHTSAPYRAVIDGKKARRTPLQTFVETMTPIDAAAFWQAFLSLDETEQADYSRRISRLAIGGRRDRAPPAVR
jgi:hypothetical protein